MSKVEHPDHYNSHPSGIECIDVVEHMGFNLGNVVKYVWRADLKGNAMEDLLKAKFYIEREISLRTRAKKENYVEEKTEEGSAKKVCIYDATSDVSYR